jgi:uncharacterized membrane protein
MADTPNYSLNQTDAASDAIRRNIELVAKLEERFLERRSFSERSADAIAAFCGSMTFVVVHAAGYSLWILINTGLIPGIPQFDKFPFLLLSMVVSLEAIFLSTFVLMAQNRMNKRADSRAHLDLQINLLTEKEMTLVLQMLRQIGTRLGIDEKFQKDEIEQLSAETPVELVADQLKEKIPD